MLSTVTDKGQVTLPKALRERLGIRPGSKVEFTLQGDDSLRVRVLSRGACGLFALLAVPGEAARSLDDIDAGVTAVVARRSGTRRPVR